MRSVGISGYGYYDGEAIGGSRLSTPIHAPSINDIKWRTLSNVPYKRFGQLDALSKTIMIAAEHIGLESLVDDTFNEQTGISIGTQDGCLGTDIDFRASFQEREIANPRLFAYTLPSTCCGDLAIRYGLKGPNACYLDVQGSGALAFTEGYHLVASGEVEACLCISADASYSQAGQIADSHSMRLASQSYAAYAFLLTGPSHKTSWVCECSEEASDDLAMDSYESFKHLCSTLDHPKNCMPSIQISYDH